MQKTAVYAAITFEEIVVVMIMSVIILLINKLDTHFMVVRFCKSLVWLQTKLDSTQSYYHYK